MNGLDPIIGTTLATRLDSVLNAVSGSTGAAGQATGAQQATGTTGATVPAGTNPAGTNAANQPPNSAETTLSNTALALNAILRLDTSLLTSTIAQQQTPLLATPPSEAGDLTAQANTQTNTQTNAETAQAASSTAPAQTETAGQTSQAAAAELIAAAETGLSEQLSAQTDAATPSNLAASLSNGSANPSAASASQTSAAASALATLAAAGSDPLASTLNTALQQAVGNSGLFYESHLADWLAGERTGDSLQSEPQAQLSNAAASTNAGQSNAAANAGDKLSNALANLLNPGGSAANANQANASTNSASAAMLAAAKQSADTATSAGIHPDAVVLVRQQLDLLATSQFQWHGQAWPGAEMDWEIARRNAEGGDSDAADNHIWHTRISLDLPVLGKVEAQLSLSGKQLTARITASAQSASTMASSSAEFRRRVAVAGLDVLALQIRQAGAIQDGAAEADDSDLDSALQVDAGGKA